MSDSSIANKQPDTYDRRSTLGLVDKGSTTVNLRMPEPFTGDRMAFKSFMQDCFLYIIHHESAFNTDEKKIIFILLRIRHGRMIH